MLSIFWAFVEGMATFWTEHILGHVFQEKPPVQVAVNVEIKMAQDIADEPSQDEAVKRLENDDV